jgi:hypothetical protein
MTEESASATQDQNNALSFQRVFCLKRKFIAFYTGNMNAADVEMYDEFHERYSAALHAGRFLQYHCHVSYGWLLYTCILLLISQQIIAFLLFLLQHYHWQTHRILLVRNEEEKWTAIGERVIEKVKQWKKSSSPNFSSKQLLLEAGRRIEGNEELQCIYQGSNRSYVCSRRGVRMRKGATTL